MFIYMFWEVVSLINDNIVLWCLLKSNYAPSNNDGTWENYSSESGHGNFYGFVAHILFS